MTIKLNKNNDTPIFKQIVNQIREQIQNGELRHGLILPSERRLAERLGVHRNTITKSYQDLKAEGYIDSIQGKGYTVTYTDNKIASSTKENSKGGVPWDYLMREEFLDYNSAFDDIFSRSHSQKGISLAGGLVPPEAYYKEDINDVLLQLVESEDEEIYGYSHYQGQLSLRKNLCSLFKTRNIIVNPSEIQVVNETNQAMDYICKLFLKKGDTVLTEEPISPDIYRPLRIMGVRVITVPVDEDGMKINLLEKLIAKHSPKFIIVSSSYQDPTGNIMSLDRRKKLLKISYKKRIPIIEEDSASEISFSDKPPSLKSLDEYGNVMYIYSFAYTFAPGFRLACIASNRQVAKKMGYLQSMHMINLDSINQSIISKYIEKGYYDKNVKKICQLYKEKAELITNLLEEKANPNISFSKPKGGVFLWCLLDEKIKMNRLVNEAYRRNLYFIPGAIFYPGGGSGDNYIRLNYSYPSKDDISQGVNILDELLRSL